MLQPDQIGTVSGGLNFAEQLVSLRRQEDDLDARLPDPTQGTSGDIGGTVHQDAPNLMRVQDDVPSFNWLPAQQSALKFQTAGADQMSRFSG